MRFLLDENADIRIVGYLRGLGHDVTTMTNYGAPDEDVIALAHAEHRILITNDRDFGELVIRQHQLHSGVILFRLRSVTLAAKIAALDRVLNEHAEGLSQFLVVTEHGIRIRRTE
jgi:predicted nuclease of predicted toxin-antitoxin system